MSKFKRFLSSFLVLTMVLGMFSMLGGVFTVDASAAVFKPYETQIKTYAELEKENPKGFFYYAAEFYESDGTPTDHVIKPGDVLTVKYYVKSSFWLTGGQFDQLFDRHVFDITNQGKKTGGRAPKPITEADGGTYFYNEGQLDNNNSTAYPVLQVIKNLDEAESANQDYEVPLDDGGDGEGGCQPAINLQPKYINFGSEYLYYDKQAGTYKSRVFTLPETTDPDYDSTLTYLSQLDVLQFKLAVHTDITMASQYRYTLDKYLFSITIKVKDDAPLGSTKVFLPDNASYLVNTDSSVKMYIADEPDLENFENIDTIGEVWGSDAAAVKVTPDMVIFDLNQEFMVTADGTYDEGGSTTTTHTVTFMNGSDQYGDPLTVAEGSTFSAPTTDPTPADGYTFAGWATTQGGTPVTFPQTMGTSDLTYYAVFNAIASHTATFMDGSKVHATQTVLEGNNITKPADPSKTGYRFLGWATTSGATAANATFPTEMGTSDVTYYAVYSANSYTVTFKNGDSTYFTGSVNYDGAYTLPTSNPSKTGYTFDKWVDDSGNAIPTTHTVDRDVTFYASFNANTYKANFYKDAAKTDLYKSVDVAFGQDIAKPADPSMEGYTFKGWSTDGKNVLTSLGKMDTEGKDFIAVFEANQLAVYFYNGETLIESKPGTINATISAIADPTPAEGYQFAGWTYDSANTQPVSWPITLGTESVTVYAKWAPKDYYLTFLGLDEWDDVIKEGNQTFGTDILFPDDPDEPGMEFLGWFDEDGNEAPVKVPAKDAVYYAKFEAAKITATFEVDGVALTPAKQGTVGESIVPPADPDKTGYTFKHWVVKGTTTPVDFSGGNVKFSADVTYVAVFEINSYTVNYYVDSELKHTETYNYGATITPWTYTETGKADISNWTGFPEDMKMPAQNLNVSASSTTNTYYVTFTVNGEEYRKVPFSYGVAIVAPTDYTYDSRKYEFSGWTLPDPNTMPARDITLNATLTEKTYTITYYISEAAYNAGEAAYNTQSYNYDQDITLLSAPSADEIPAGYTFLNWDCAYTKMPAQNINVFGVLSAIDYKVTFAHYNEGTASFAEWTNKHYNDVISAADVPNADIREGYSFDGWKIDGQGSFVEFPYTVKGDVKFVPCYTAEGYTITYKIDGEQYGNVESKNFGDSITLRSEPSKTGYTFSGWTIKVDGSEVASLPATMPAANIEITGSYTVNQYAAVFNAGEGAFADEDTISEDGKTITVMTNYGEKPVCPETPTRAGYAFTGWTPALANMTEAGANYTATYSAGAVNYTINTYVMGTDGEYPAAPTTTVVKTATAGQEVDAEYSITTGFELDRDNDKAYISGIVSGDGKTVFSVYIARNTYSFKLTSDGATVVDTTYYYEQAIPAVADPEKTGSTFVKWSDTIPTTMPAKNFSATAEFRANTYTITIDTDGGNYIPNISGNYGDPVTKPSDPTKTGYTFAGWDNDFPTTMPAENMTIKATWTANQYTITFETNGGTSVASITQDYGTSIAKPADPEKTGYTFAGWDKVIPTTMPAYDMTITAKWNVNTYKAKFIIDGKTTEVPTEFGKVPVAPNTDKLGYTFNGWKEGSLVAMPANDVTYTAVYEAKTYNAVFDANGGSWSGTTSKDVSTVFDTAIVKPDTDPSRPNFAFKGWSTDGSTVLESLGNMTTEGITFLAVWKQDLGTCAVQDVTRVTENVYGRQTANYEIKVNGSPIKLEITNEGRTFYWQYDRNDDFVAIDEAETTGIYSIKAYNAEGQEVALGSTATSYEIWGIRAVLTEGTYKFRAKITHSADSWESVDNAYEYTLKYDVEPIDPKDFSNATASNTTVTRGEYITFTLTTSDKVNRVRLARTEADGSLTTISYSTDVALDNCTITENNDGTRTWVITVRFSYPGNDDEKTEIWKFQYRKVDGTSWIDSNYSYNIKITKYKEVESPVEGKDPYSVISVTAPEGVTKGGYGEFTVVTTDDVTRVRLTVNGKASSYLKTSSNVKGCVDNGDGTLTWTIKCRLNASGNLDVSAQARGNKWSTAVSTTCTVA